MGQWRLSLVILASAYLGLALADCPDADSLRPCTCDHDGVNCMRALSTAQLRQSFRSGDAITREQKELWIQKTPITSFPSNVLGNFKFGEVHVELNANLSSFTLDALMNFNRLLSVLSVYGNSLQTFEFNKLQRFPFLETLNVGGNQLSSIPANAFRSTSLRKLVLTGNPITFIGPRAFFSLSRLEDLLLSRTRVTTLGPHSLSIQRAPPQLKIHVTAARISTIHPTAFGSTSPFVMNLSFNNLTTLERHPFEPLVKRMLRNGRQLKNVPLLGIEGNPLTCRGCSYEWLIPYSLSTQMQSVLREFRCPDGSGLSSISAPKITCKLLWNYLNLG